VEPEVVLADYELTAMNSPESSFYERKRMAAAETTAGPAAAALGDLYAATAAATRSRSGSRSPTGNRAQDGPLTLDDGRIECGECGRQYSSVVAYNKHAYVHR